MKVEWIALCTAFLMPLIFWPPSLQPFSAAKDWLLLVWALLGFGAVCITGRVKKKLPWRIAAATTVWIIALSLSAGTGDEASVRELMRNLLACAGFPLLVWMEVPPRKIALACVFGGTIVALVAILQWIGLDPFLLLNLTGSLQGNSRIRIFSTLGNPNFVAAVLATILPLIFFIPASEDCSQQKWRFFQIGAGLMVLCAIAATGSRAPIPGFIAAGVWLLLRRTRLRLRWFFLGMAVCIALPLISPARSLEKTIAGRIYIWRIVITHIPEIPPAGYGPGAFALRFAQWETEYVRTNPRSPDSAFSGLQEHAHDDYLEFLVDYGIAGFCAFFIAVGLAARITNRQIRSAIDTGAGASLIILMAIAVVDFPLHRPAELYLFWTLLAIPWILVDRISPTPGN